MKDRSSENRRLKHGMFIVLMSIGLFSSVGCNDPIRQMGYEINIDNETFRVSKGDGNRRMTLKLLSTDIGSCNDYLIAFALGRTVVYNGKWIDNRLIEIAIPDSLNDKNLSATIVFYKEGSSTGYYFEPKTSFYLHPNDNMLFVVLEKRKSYTDFPLIGSAMIK